MTHRAETILSTVQTLLDGLTTTGSNVERGRVRVVEDGEYPSLTIGMGGDDVNPDLSNYPEVHRDLNLKIIIHVKNNTAPYTQLNLIREEVYKALLSDPTLGLGYVVDSNSLSDEEPEFTGEADQIVGQQVMNFSIEYRHSWTDPGA